MTDDDLTPEELETLQRMQLPNPAPDKDPHHFAKLLSLALIEQREGGPELTEAGRERVTRQSEVAGGPQ